MGKRNGNKRDSIIFGIAVVILALVIYFSATVGNQKAEVITANGNITTANMKEGTIIIVNTNQRIDNFFLVRLNPDTVFGLLYIEYPLTSNLGKPTTLSINDTIGYSCDGTLSRFIGINSSGAKFAVAQSNASRYGCPI